MNVDENVSAATLIKWYCVKAGRNTEALKLCLRFDGERVESSTLVKDMDIEDKDLVDVERL